MRIQVGQTGTVTIALRPVGEIAIDIYNRIPARVEQGHLDVGSKVVVEKSSAFELIVRAVDPDEVIAVGKELTTPGVRVETDIDRGAEFFGFYWKNNDLRQLIIHLVLFSLIPGLVMSLLLYTHHHDLSSALLGFAIGAFALPIVFVILWIFGNPLP